jgi:hypothetical protein
VPVPEADTFEPATVLGFASPLSVTVPVSGYLI